MPLLRSLRVFLRDWFRKAVGQDPSRPCEDGRGHPSHTWPSFSRKPNDAKRHYYCAGRGECRSLSDEYKGRRLLCEVGGSHDGSHMALVEGEPVFWGRGLQSRPA